MSQQLNGKVALVTGASKGIGAEIARQMAAAGAKVIVNYASSRSGAEKVVSQITAAGGSAVALQADMADEQQVRRLFADATKAFGRIDTLVNNAGVYEFLPLEKVTPEHFQKLYSVNVLGLLLASREAAAQFGPAGGSIINISSAVVSATPPESSVYASTKAAVDTITRVLSKELGPKKVRVNSLSPGLTETEGTDRIGYTGQESEFTKMLVAQTPLGRIGKPRDIAPVAVFLASDDAAWITGEVLFASGGSR